MLRLNNLKNILKYKNIKLNYIKNRFCTSNIQNYIQPFVGNKAPDFECLALIPSIDNKEGKISLKDYKGKYVVLFFYPLDFTFVCPTEIIAFSDNVERFKKLNCEVIGASCDSYFSHLSWTKMDRKNGGLGKIKIPIIADKSTLLSQKYNVLIKEKGFPLRGLFVIDGKGILRYMSVNDTGVGRNIDEVLRIVEAFQFSDKYGEVCPINWKPGSKGMDPKKADEFFSSNY